MAHFHLKLLSYKIVNLIGRCVVWLGDGRFGRQLAAYWITLISLPRRVVVLGVAVLALAQYIGQRTLGLVQKPFALGAPPSVGWGHGPCLQSTRILVGINRMTKN